VIENASPNTKPAGLGLSLPLPLLYFLILFNLFHMYLQALTITLLSSLFLLARLSDQTAE
jgi:hypothetical protein